MTMNVPVKMLYPIAVCPVLLVSAVLTLTIDSQLGTSVEDCFERISIGEQLPNDAIYRNISELTTKECEQICKQDKQCQSFDYGVGAKGNATCDLSMLNEKEIKDRNVLRRHSDYDVYVRRFQCEQSPPTPIQAEFEDPDGLLQRPAIKPAIDSKLPLSDELPDDPGSYGNSKPGDKQTYNDERPDGYDNSKPDYDIPPSYGLHKPQDIPYGSEKPQISHSNTRPDPYDVLQLHDPYGRPRPQSWRPQEMYGHRPIDYGLNLYQEEKPQYQYIIRPNRKPHYQETTRPESGDLYGNNKPNHYGKPEYNGQTIPPSSLDRPDLPYKPSNGYPARPEQKPSYSYNSQYASNYGSHYDNSIYLEINDPPRPYKPPFRPNRPSYGIDEGDYEYGHLGYGYDTFSAQNSYSHSQNSHSQYYGSGVINDNNNYRPNQQPNHKPTRPLDNQGSGYGTLNNQNNNVGYGSQTTTKPHEINNKPASAGYDSQGVTGNYGNSGNSGYGSNNHFSSSHSYVGSGNYESSSQSYYNNHISNNKPSYGNHGYNNENNQSQYNKPYGGQEYGGSSQSYHGNEQNSFSHSNKPQGSSGYQNNQQENAFGGNYGYGSQVSNNKPYVTNSGYGSSSQSSHVSNGEAIQSINKPYGESQGYGGSSKPPIYGDNNQKPYGGSYEEGYESSGGYHSNQVSHGNSYYGGSNLHSSSNRPHGNTEGYGGQNIDNNNYNSYGGNGQAANKPYGSGYNDRPSYNGHGGGNYGDISQTSGYINRPPSNIDRPTSSQSYYNSQHNSQFSSQSSFESSSSYGQTGSSFQKPGNQSSYGSGNDLYRPNVKPVYEYEIDRPGNAPNYIYKPNGDVITSKPVVIGDYSEQSGYGRNPTEPMSYKAYCGNYPTDKKIPV